MFTGIITDVANVTKQKSAGDVLTLTFARPKGWKDLELGESVATDGACLTVSALRPTEYECQLMSETLAKTSFGSKVPGRVNLERSLTMKDRLSGHFVQGHVDGVGRVAGVDTSDGYVIAIEFPPDFADVVIYKGSITINGVSLTITKIAKNVLSVALIPHTLEHTTLGDLKKGDKVNLEFDMIGKYIVNYLGQHKQQ